MNGAELKEQILKNGLYPIPVCMPADDSSRPRFEGTLDEFWAAAKALGAKAVFLEIRQMDESDFEQELSSKHVPRIDEDDDDDSFDGQTYTVDLEQTSPSISKFRKYVGKDCAFVIIAKGEFAELDFLITESWWDEFQDEAEKTVEAWMEKRGEQAEEVEAKTAKRTKELLGQLKALMNDREFCLLKTQRAMLAYAIEKIPELEELSEFVLKPEIQTLHARIEAKGLNKK
jgi:hypothetical protein